MWKYEKQNVDVGKNATKEELLNIRAKHIKDKFCWWWKEKTRGNKYKENDWKMILVVIVASSKSVGNDQNDHEVI